MENNKELYLALSKADFPDLVKGSKGQRGKYVKLPALWNSIRKPLKDAGLHLIQTVICKDGIPFLLTKIIHLGTGQYDESLFPLALDEASLQHNTRMQVEGGTQTYHRRYQIKLILGLAEEDDDNDGDLKKDSSESKSEARSQFINDKQKNLLLMKLKDKPEKGADIIQKYHISSFGQLPWKHFNEVLKFIEE